MKYLYALVAVLLSGLTQAQNPGDNLFEDTYVHEIYVTFYETAWWDSLEVNYDALYDGNGDLIIGSDKKYMRASITIDGNTLDTVGVRLKGYFSNWGSNSDKKPFKVDINEFVSGQKYDDVKKFNLNNCFLDPTMLRDKLSLDMMADAGVPAPRCAHAKLYLNGTYWGLYSLIEQVDKTFLETNYGHKNGNLYKNMSNSPLNWQGTNPISYKDEFEKKTNETEDDWTDFVHLVDVINNSGSAFHDSIHANLEMHTFLTSAAVDRFMNNWDSYQDHGRNYYVYNDTILGKFRWIPWDYNLSFSSSTLDLIYTPPVWPWEEDKPLMEYSMNNSNLKDGYLSIACQLVNEWVIADTFNARVDSLADMIRQAVYDDTKKETSNQQFDTNLTNTVVVDGQPYPGLKSLVAQRLSIWQTDIAAEGFDCATVGIPDPFVAMEWNLYPNPTDGRLTIDWEQYDVDQPVCHVFNSNGQLIREQQITDTRTTLDLTDQSTGVYLVRISGADYQSVKKVIVR